MTVLLVPFERRWAHATLDTLFPRPGRGALPLGIEDMDVDSFLDETLAHVPFESALGLRLAFWIIGLAPLFVLGKLQTIASLEPDDRLRVLSALSNSPIYALRGMITMVKAIASLFYCGDRRVRPSMFVARSPVVALRLRDGGRPAAALPASSSAPSEPPPPVSSSTPSMSTPGAEHEPHRRTA
jgi:hypothetical protein